MGSIYIAKGITKQANIGDNWEEFDEIDGEMSKLAKHYGVWISRCDKKGEQYFVVSNIRLSSVCFYEGSIFEGDMGVPDDESFESKADLFINELNSIPEFSFFHNLNWSDAARRYYAHS